MNSLRSNSRPLRVLVIAPSMAQVGGQSVQAEMLRTRLAAESSLAIEFQPIDPPFPRWMAPLRRVPLARTLPNEALYLAQLRKALARCDVAHVFAASYFSFLLAPTPAILMARRLGKPVILNYHSGEAEDHLSRWPSALRTLRLATRIVVPSGYLVEVFRRHGLASHVVPNAVDLGRFRFRERDGAAPRFLVNRNFEAHYNVACVLQAFAIVQASRPEAVLTVAGDGPEGGALRDLSRTLGLRRVRFAGRVEATDMPALYGDHDIWLNGSDVDNMPLSILEAFASGVAVVSTDAGGIPWLVEEGRTGRLVPRADAPALAQAALDLLGDRAAFRRITSAAKGECARFTWEPVREGWLAEYARLAPGRPGPTRPQEAVAP